jgi:hypothetical protein
VRGHEHQAVYGLPAYNQPCNHHTRGTFVASTALNSFTSQNPLFFFFTFSLICLISFSSVAINCCYIALIAAAATTVGCIGDGHVPRRVGHTARGGAAGAGGHVDEVRGRRQPLPAALPGPTQHQALRRRGGGGGGGRTELAQWQCGQRGRRKALFRV